jgi:hypothetical protein
MLHSSWAPKCFTSPVCGPNTTRVTTPHSFAIPTETMLRPSATKWNSATALCLHGGSRLIIWGIEVRVCEKRTVSRDFWPLRRTTLNPTVAG